MKDFLDISPIYNAEVFKILPINPQFFLPHGSNFPVLSIWCNRAFAIKLNH